jgi:F-type H+-transporting ATPase subunit delta
MLKTTIAKRYARALFDTMPEKKNLFECLETLDNNVLTPHDFWHNPLIEPRQYLDFFKITGKSFKASKAWGSFGTLLLEHKRISLMPFIIKEYLTLCEKNTKIVITTATPFSTQEQKKLVHWAKQKIQENMGKRITSVLTVDETLLAGFRIEGDTFVYDASLKHKLQNLEKALL